MKFSGMGAIVGACLGALCRAVVVWANLGIGISITFVLPSASIGVLVGLIAGGTGRPLRGLLLGGILSGLIFELFMLPCASLIGTFGSLTGDASMQGEFLRRATLYALEMGLAGAVAGGLGALAGQAYDRRQIRADDDLSAPNPAKGPD